MTTTAGAVGLHVLPAVDELDRAVFSEGDCFDMGEAEEADLRLGAIRQAVARHVAGSLVYARLAERAGFDVDGLEREEDLGRVPVLPTTAFKRTAIRSSAGGTVIRAVLSSGTSGRVSAVERDEVSLQRLLGSVRSGLRLLERGTDFDFTEVEVVNLGPSRAEARDVWFGYVMGLVEVIAETRHCVRDGRLDLAMAATELATLSATAQDVFLVGPPIFVAELARYVRARDVRVRGEAVTVITGGGWKTLDEAAPLSRPDLATLVGSALRIGDGSRIRDAFNQVELNSVLMECQLGWKHAPPWLYPLARDAWLRPLPDGEPGLLSFLDPTPSSYPGFIVGDDVGRVEPGRCPCGNAGRRVELLRRLASHRSEGCALKMATRFSLPIGET